MGSRRILSEDGLITQVVGETPLSKAVEQGNGEIVKILLRYGADPNIMTEHGNLAIDIARKKGYRQIAEILDNYRR